MQGSLQPPAEAAQATGTTTPTLAPAPPLETSDHAEPDQEENVPTQSKDAMQEENVPTQPEDAMQLDGTPVEEEPTPLGDSTTDAFFLDAWPRYNPYQ